MRVESTVLLSNNLCAYIFVKTKSNRMDSFLNLGRCRVCGQMFCCRKHQLEHERVMHDEYADWLDMLPTLCRRCHRTVKNVHDFNANCIQFNMKHTLLTNSKSVDSSSAGTPKRLNRKRVITVNVRREVNEQPSAERDSDDSSIDTALVESRKTIIASRRLKKQMSPVVLLDLNEIKNRDDIITAVFSPQFNISQNILSGDAKSSTPLYEEKENLPVIAIFDKTDMCMYQTPDTIQNASLVVVSALKKTMTSREGIIKDGNSKMKKPNSRKVTFEMVKTPEVENISVYATPVAEMFSPERRCVNADQQEMTIRFEKVEENEIDSQVEISIYGTLGAETGFVVESLDTETKKGRDCAAVSELVRNMKSAVTGIPRMIFNACGWSMRTVIRKRKNDDTSPICPMKVKQNRRTLKRRPISSHWINLSGSSLRRRPLAAYRGVDEESVLC